MWSVLGRRAVGHLEQAGFVTGRKCYFVWFAIA